MYILLIRTLILYSLVVLTLRLMGKKQIGELQPFELAVTIMVSDLASLPMQDTRIPIVHGVIPIITLLFLQAVLSLLELKSEKIRSIVNGTPSILIKDGKIDLNQLKKQNFTASDLLEELRLKNYYNIEDIQFAILETNGQLSLIPKTELTAVTKADMQIKTTQDKLPTILILDGHVNYKNLKMVKKDEKWLKENLKNTTTPFKNIFIAVINSKGEFYYQKKETNKK